MAVGAWRVEIFDPMLAAVRPPESRPRLGKRFMTKFAILAGAAAIALLAGNACAQTSEEATKAALATIQQRNPVLRAVIATNPNALSDARALDAERKAGKVRSALHGVPILLKDNIESADPLPTTAGSLA
ncbi:MAG: amidase family protein, partial [Caulobacter sp.]